MFFRDFLARIKPHVREARIFLLAIVSIPLFSACGKYIIEDLSYLKEFVELNFPQTQTTINKDVDLYVDYSTCVAEAQKSEYFRKTHPAFVDCAPTFYSIKGSKITEETKDSQKVYQLLSTVKEVNNADIKQAVAKIVARDNQAVLITDGEYYMKDATRDNLNNPYLAEDFRTWLKKGYDIYIISEPYLESGKFSKFRFYFLFTDSKLPNNIYDRFVRSAPLNSAVKMLHLNNGAPKVSRKDKTQDINESLSPVEDNCSVYSTYEVQEYAVLWKDIKSFLATGSLKERYLTRGIFVNLSEYDGYKIEAIEPVVYLIAEDYQEYVDSATVSAKVMPHAKKLIQVKDVFSIDKHSFEDDGEIVLTLDKNFDGVGNTLSSDWPNLLRVDFVVTKVSDNFSSNEELNSAFQWRSISSAQGGAMNTSILESVSQVLKDPDMSPVDKETAVLYTIYLSTYSL